MFHASAIHQESFHPIQKLGGEVDVCLHFFFCRRGFESILVNIPFTPDISIKDDPFQFQCSGCHICMQVLFNAELALLADAIPEENSPGSMKDRYVCTVYGSAGADHILPLLLLHGDCPVQYEANSTPFLPKGELSVTSPPQNNPQVKSIPSPRRMQQSFLNSW